MIKFLRNTHLNGKYRQELDRYKYIQPSISGLGVHALDSNNPKTLDEFIDFHIKYAKDFNEQSPEISDLLIDLSILIDYDFVKIVKD